MNVHNIFEENNTVYVVEENEDLIPFEGSEWKCFSSFFVREE